jgi:hypothetical protein
MASDALLKKLETAKKDLSNVPNNPTFRQISGNEEFKASFNDADKLARKWLDRAEPLLGKLEESSLQPLVNFAEKIVGIVDRDELRRDENVPNGMRRVMTEFRPAVPELVYGLLEASGITRFSDEDFPQKRIAALDDIIAARDKASDVLRGIAEVLGEDIRKTASDAVLDFENAKAAASKISVDAAQKQFDDAAKTLRRKAVAWTSISIALFGALIVLLLRFAWYPPPLISEVMNMLKPSSQQAVLPVSVPLLIAASAYFTSIRLALIGVLGIGMAFSLRMTRAYLQMIEHNHHKSRVTKSIEAFVASVRTAEQKDFVLGKLIDSVTMFGDSGILDKDGDKSSSGLPSVFFDAITKNVTKAS